MGRVCILLPGHWSVVKGGAEYQAHLLAEYIEQHTEHDVSYLTARADDSLETPYEVQVFRRSSLFAHRGFGHSVDAGRVYRALRDIAPDILIQMVASAHTGVAAFYSRKYGIPMFWYLASDADLDPMPNLGVRGPARYLDKLLFEYGRRHSSHVIAQTSNQAELMKARFQRTCDAVIANFHPPAQQEISRSLDQFVVLWIANLKKLKRPELFLDIARKCEDNPAIRFKLIGEAEQSEWCDTVLQQASEMRNVDYLGQLSIDEVNCQISRSHLLVNTSEYEGLPNTFLQAWMREVPTLTLTVDPDGVIGKHNLGYVQDDTAALADEIRSYADDPCKLGTTGRNAKRYADSAYSMANAQAIVDLISASETQ